MDAMHLEFYRSNGWTKIEKVFSPSEIEQFKSQIEFFIQEVAPKLSGRHVNYVDGRVNSIHCLASEDNFFSTLVKSEKIKNLAAFFLEDDAEPRGSELFAKPAKVGLPSPLHQDDYYLCIDNHNGLTVWVALDTVNEENGGVMYYSGSHKHGLIPHVPSFAPGSSQKIGDESTLPKFERVVPVLQPGDVLVHHAMTIHGSGPNRSDRSRRGLTMQYKGASSGYDLGRKKQYEASLQAQIKLREQQRAKQ